GQTRMFSPQFPKTGRKFFPLKKEFQRETAKSYETASKEKVCLALRRSSFLLKLPDTVAVSDVFRYNKI
ncbi:MAG: hypothetical protein IJG56_03855, partial [Clostridia bacterium]|nr:hypothetical protein [Clostridia bacterium]